MKILPIYTGPVNVRDSGPGENLVKDGKNQIQVSSANDVSPATATSGASGKADAKTGFFTTTRIVGLVLIIAVLGGAIWWYNKK